MRIIVFCGPKTCGKDTAAKYLLARNSLAGTNLFEQHNFADNLKACCAQMFGFNDKQLNDMPFKELPLEDWPHETPRYHMQNVAKIMRTYYGGDVWVRGWQRGLLVTQTQCVVVTDLRHTEELDALEQLGAIIFYVKRKEAEDALSIGRSRGDPLCMDISEQLYDLLERRAVQVIPNDGTVDELHTRVHEAVKQHVGDWSTWMPGASA